jgi:hypothetical protein
VRKAGQRPQPLGRQIGGKGEVAFYVFSSNWLEI